MTPLAERSGLWAGLWTQDRHRGAMRALLSIEGVAIRGDGADECGAFSLVGEHDHDARVCLLKGYCAEGVSRGACPLVVYTGTWNGTFIAGRWQDPTSFLNAGQFELWPVEEEVAMPVEKFCEELTAGRA